MTSATVKAKVHKDKDKTEQDDITTVPAQNAEKSEPFCKPHDGLELRRGLLNSSVRKGNSPSSSNCSTCEGLLHDVWSNVYFESIAVAWPNLTRGVGPRAGGVNGTFMMSAVIINPCLANHYYGTCLSAFHDLETTLMKLNCVVGRTCFVHYADISIVLAEYLIDRLCWNRR